MATSVNFSRFFAALAAGVILTLAGCGGGEEMTVQPTATEEAAARQAFNGPAISQPTVLNPGEAHKRTLLASTASEKKGPWATFTAEALGTTVKAGTAQAALAPTEYTNAALLDWAQSVYPELFPGTPLVFDDVVAPDGNHYYARYYAVTQNYVGVCLGGGANTCIVGGAYGLGPYTVGALTYFGHKDAYKCLVNAEWCRPKVTSVTPADGATGVEIKNVAIKVNFDRRLSNCPENPITGTFGAINGTLTCVNAASTATVTITATTLPDNSRITATLSGFRGAEGEVEMAAHIWSFTTRKGIVTVLETKVLTTNLFGHLNGMSPASILDPVTFAVSQRINLPKVPGYLLPSHIHVDVTRDVAYVGTGFGFVLYRFNPKTGEVLPAISIEDPVHWNERAHGVQGIAGSTNEVCIVTGRWNYQSQYAWRNRLICFHPDTGAQTFVSATDFLGTVTEIPTKLLYAPSRQKYYVLMATEGCLQGEEAGGNSRDGYCAGSAGRLVEINATTKARERSWLVGSMPLAAKLIGDRLYVLKSGDRGATIVNLTSGATQSVDWSGIFGKYAYPVDIEMDEAKGVYYVSDWLNSVRIMSLATNQQVGAVTLPAGRVPRSLRMVAGNLWVLAPLRDIFYTDAQSAYIINTNTRTVTQTITEIGGATLNDGNGGVPWDLAVYERTEVR